MRSDALARRYAKGLVLATAEPAHLDRIGEELELVSDALLSSPESFHLLTGPLFPLSAVQSLMADVVEHFGLSPVLNRFLGLLAQRKRLPLLDRIVHQYQQLADEAQGRITAQVQSAIRLTPAQREGLSHKLAGVFGRRVRLNISVEPELLGGMVVRAGSTVIDGTMRNQLKRLQSFIRERPSG